MSRSSEGERRELERQQRLVQAIRGGSNQQSLLDWARDLRRGAAGERLRGLRVYEGNALGLAQRALGANFPTVQALLGEDEFRLLAREVWRRLPAERGDLDLYGEGLPDFLADQPLPAALAYLPDVARLDWAVARALVAVDVEPDPGSFQALGREDSLAWRARLAPGLALVESVWPIVAVWEAHHRPDLDANERFAHARESIGLSRGETAWVWRGGWRVLVAEVPETELSFLRALMAGAALGSALDRADEGFDLSVCLQRGLQQGWWMGMVPPTGIEPVFAA